MADSPLVGWVLESLPPESLICLNDIVIGIHLGSDPNERF